jgi:hypothetical protein
MVSGNAKRVVVIRDIPSNIIEEAILVLKSDVGGKDVKACKEVPLRKKGHDFLLKEAELIINNYIQESKLSVATPKVTDNKQPWFRNRLFTNTIINTALIGSIAVLIFFISRMF